MAPTPSPGHACPSGPGRARASRWGRSSDVVIANRPDPPVQPGCRASPPQPALRVADAATGVLLAGRYRLAKLVGRGAMARVWRAQDELLNRAAAVKQIDQPHAHGLLEARLAARVRHPHVVGVQDVVVHAGSSWLVMDYHGGARLGGGFRGRRRRLPPPPTPGPGLPPPP